ncbi:hypothetical protein M408DRAFT_23411 [Serendipita vermifera MAFF 305830]|uniref:NAD-dependent epimerase/dehydratase domain-containing protein n=1 Tax=Serendipita vermifera MAFF 305830 TaxID=933852 RepID=A0A0C3B9G8_SERVB|nr:hypothetical protein M408DRAFT_23411 [Serendipita vermifera MAFF 305830]
MPSIFILGASGYIGGAVLTTFLKGIPDLKATALVRNEAHIPLLSGIGVTCIKGTSQDLALVSELSSHADIVFNAADADDLNLSNAILEGCKKRFAATAVKPIYLHTSGTAIFMDGAKGIFNSSAHVFDDRKTAEIRDISPTAWHRNVEQSVVDADEASYVSAYIISPSGVYGESPSPIPRTVILTKMVIDLGKNFKTLPYIGDGSNVLALIHVNDMAAAYLTVLKFALSGKDTESGYGRYYIANTGEVSWKDLITAYAPPLKQRGIIDTTELSLVTLEQAPLMSFFGANVFAVAGKLRDLGWKPNGPSIFETIERDLEIALASEK